MSDPVIIRSCHALEEFHACVELQREIWGEEALEVEPATMFVVAANTGGQVLGAFVSDELIGFTLAVGGIREGEPYLHSHMTGIKEGFRDRGVGRALKLFQREEALDRDVRLIEWTFDPLELRNAHFNLNRLGAICRKYLPNLYGVTTSPLHRGQRTDRLLAEWRLKDPRVVAATGKGSAEVFRFDGATSTFEIFVPKELPYDLTADASKMAALQDRLRDHFTKCFEMGYAATAVTLGNDPAYVLTPYDKQMDRLVS
jgi:predicted GNAT superfamily acetyltransferase